jgi:YedE family putative selenium metabolism protein
MAFGALVFLGCPFRMLQRLGGGDANALVGLPGFLAGVGFGLALEKRGYSVGKTAVVPRVVGLLGPLTLVLLLVLFLAGGVLLGPGPGDAPPPPHAHWLAALAISLAAGAVLSATGFCAVSGARQVFGGSRRMLFGAAALVGGYALVAAATGNFRLGFGGQPVAHGDHLWSFLALALVGLCGVLAGGCPVRQLVMAGEGNGDAFLTTMGLVVGGALAHNWDIVSSPDGSTAAGRWAVAIGLALAAAYGVARALPRALPSRVRNGEI